MLELLRNDCPEYEPNAFLQFKKKKKKKKEREKENWNIKKNDGPS